MHEGLETVRDALGKAMNGCGRDDDCQLIAVSKTFDADAIRPVLESGQRVFGENRVQEAQVKWPDLRADYPDVELHLIGPLQSNKAADAVALFDAIHSVDREKIAVALAKEMKRQERTPDLFVQVNTGEEKQKAGIVPRRCRCVRSTLPRGARAGDCRTHVHPACGRKSGAPFRIAAKTGFGGRCDGPVDGHVRRLRDGHSVRRNPCAGWQRDFRHPLIMAEPSRSNRVKRWLDRLSNSKKAMPTLALASFAEALIVPIPLELVLIPFMVTNRQRLWLTALVVTLGCLVAAVIGYFVGMLFFETAGRWVIDLMGWSEGMDRFRALFADHGFLAILAVGIIPIPFQVAMLTAGAVGYPLSLFLLAAAIARGLRYFGLAALVWWLGDTAEAAFRRHKTSFAFGVTLLFAIVIGVTLLSGSGGQG